MLKQPDISAKDAVVPGLFFIAMFLFIGFLAIDSGLSKYYELESCRVEKVGEVIPGRKTFMDRRKISFVDCGPPVGNNEIEIHAPSSEVRDPPIEGGIYNIRVKQSPRGPVTLVSAEVESCRV